MRESRQTSESLSHYVHLKEATVADKPGSTPVSPKPPKKGENQIVYESYKRLLNDSPTWGDFDDGLRQLNLKESGLGDPRVFEVLDAFIGWQQHLGVTIPSAVHDQMLLAQELFTALT